MVGGSLPVGRPASAHVSGCVVSDVVSSKLQEHKDHGNELGRVSPTLTAQVWQTKSGLVDTGTALPTRQRKPLIPSKRGRNSLSTIARKRRKISNAGLFTITSLTPAESDPSDWG